MTQGPPASGNTATYPSIAITIARRPLLANVAVSGETCTQMASNFSSVVTPHFNAGFTINFASLLCGYNDISGGRTPAQIYGDMSSWITSCKAAGFTCMLATLTDTTRGTEADRTTLNGLITGGAVAGMYTVIPFGADPTVGCNGCAATATSDGTHPTAASQLIMGQITAPVLVSLGD